MRGPSLNGDQVPEEEIQGAYFSPWFVFNDFTVKNITEQEALAFPGSWKVSQYVC